MKFVDSTEIRVRSGRGGSGMVSFKSARNMPKLGADGGDGGFGGSVYLVGANGLNTLSGLYFRQLYAAQDGGKGGPNGKTGADGEDLEVTVPLGTVAINKITGAVLGEITKDGERLLVAKGGKRGLGNIRYLTATHQAPEECTKGGPAEEVDLDLELKVIADVGLAGFPNAGKSTLISRISRARPKIADYPFTTLVPHLGVVSVEDEAGTLGASFVAADIPGLIEGASEGRGLGHEFLKHLERTKVIVFVLDGFSVEGLRPRDAFEKLRFELERYSEELVRKRFVIVVTKADLKEYNPDWDEQLVEVKELGYDMLEIASVTGFGLNTLKKKLYELVRQEQTIHRQVERRPKVDMDGFEFLTRAGDDEILGHDQHSAP